MLTRFKGHTRISIGIRYLANERALAKVLGRNRLMLRNVSSVRVKVAHARLSIISIQLMMCDNYGEEQKFADRSMTRGNKLIKSGKFSCLFVY